MIKKILLLAVWFPVTLSILIFQLVLLHRSLRLHNEEAKTIRISAGLHLPVTAASHMSRIVEASILAGDARMIFLSDFLEKHSSPMAPYAQFIVEQSDEQALDYRLIPAIAMCESNLGKKMPAHQSFNPFGIAVYTGQQSGKKFETWDHAITWVAKYLKNRYFDQHITDLDDIGAIWAPPSVEKGNSWSRCVKTFMDRIVTSSVF